MINEITVKDAGKKGKGVFALRSFSRGEFIFRRRHGRVIRNEEIPSLSADLQIHLCELDWNGSAILLLPGCYLNHSCDPIAIRKGTYVYAWKDSEKGEEITIDYRLNAFSNKRYVCYCGSQNCPGYYYLSYFSLSEGRQIAYFSYAPKFIQDEYHRRKSRIPNSD